MLTPAFTASGQAALAELRAKGQDPAHSEEARRKVGEANACRTKQYKARKKGQGKFDAVTERERFVKEILPKLADVPLSRIAQATQLSKGYASRIRKGEYAPDPMHYAALRAVVDGEQV